MVLIPHLRVQAHDIINYPGLYRLPVIDRCMPRVTDIGMSVVYSSYHLPILGTLIRILTEMTTELMTFFNVVVVVFVFDFVFIIVVVVVNGKEH